ncbi:MAG: hypothetical protein M3R24_26285 [Chloroflexota bacterium]|nr:hypothetical protein [Chloroflexota bacterium]
MARIVSKTPGARAVQERQPRPGGIPTENQHPLTVTQAKVVRALLPPHRTLALKPPHSGTIRLARDVLTVKHQTFRRLQQLGALILDAGETEAGQREVYRLSDTGRAVWAEQCLVAGQPRPDPAIDE